MAQHIATVNFGSPHPRYWTPSARVVGDAIVRLVREDPHTQTGDHALIGRFRKLVNDGRLESEGNLSEGLRDTRVRRPPSG